MVAQQSGLRCWVLTERPEAAALGEGAAQVLALSIQLEKTAEMLTVAQQHNSGDFASMQRVLQRMDGAHAQVRCNASGRLIEPFRRAYDETTKPVSF